MATIVKRGKQNKPSYYVVYRIDGIQKWKFAGKRRIDADRLKAKIENDLHTGEYQEIPDISFKDFSAKFIEAHASRVREQTLAMYEGHLRRTAIPFFDKRRLKSIRAVDIEAYLSYLKKLGTSPATSAKQLRTLKMLLKKAVQWGYLTKSPAEHIPMPRVPKQEMNYLNPTDIEKLIANTNERYRCLITTACYTGMRQGELLGLQWGDVDFEGKRIFVRRTLQKGKFYEPKTKYSRRSVSIPNIVVQSLRSHQINQVVHLENNHSQLVFTNDVGEPIDPSNLTKRVFEPALKMAGLIHVRFHDLRHSYAAALISAGENPKWIQKQLGHSSIMITLDIYGHLLPETEKNASERLEQALVPGNKIVHLTAI